MTQHICNCSYYILKANFEGNLMLRLKYTHQTWQFDGFRKTDPLNQGIYFYCEERINTCNCFRNCISQQTTGVKLVCHIASTNCMLLKKQKKITLPHWLCLQWVQYVAPSEAQQIRNPVLTWVNGSVVSQIDPQGQQWHEQLSKWLSAIGRSSDCGQGQSKVARAKTGKITQELSYYHLHPCVKHCLALNCTSFCLQSP